MRLQEVDGALRITELYVDGEGAPIGAGGLRRFALQAAEETARFLAESDPHHERSVGAPGPDLSRLATYYSTVFGVREGGEPARPHWVADSMHAQVASSQVRQAPKVGLPSTAEQADPDLPHIDPPDGRLLTDEYLTTVASAYAAAVAHRMPPAKTLAPMAGVSEKTIHSWVAKARKRGLMPPAARKGRVV